MAAFPPEILDHILSLLKKDKAALAVCLKASPLLGAVAERYLYEHISLETITKPLEQALQVYLSSHPRASYYVKSVTVFFSDSSAQVNTSQGNAAPKRLTEAYSFTDLPRLPLLETLVLTTKPSTSVNWSSIRENQGDIWMKIACLPTLKNLVLRGISHFPFDVLDRCRNLKRVGVLGDTKYEMGYLEEAPELSSTEAQRHLTVHNPAVKADIRTWLRRSKKVLGTPWFMHLQSLDFRGVNDQDFKLLFEVLRACSKSLRELEFDASNIFTQYCFSSSSAKPTQTLSSGADYHQTQKLESYIPLSLLSLTKLTIHSTLRFMHFAVLVRLGIVPSSASSFADLDAISYFSSIKEIGDLLSLAKTSTPKHQQRTRTDTQPAPTPTLITLVMHIHEAHTPGAPTLANVDFRPLDAGSFVISDRCSPSSLALPINVAINAVGEAKLCEVLPQLEKNTGLREMVEVGQVVVMVGEYDMAKFEERLCLKELTDAFEVYKFGETS